MALVTDFAPPILSPYPSLNMATVKEECIKFLTLQWQEEDIGQSSINTEHPDFFNKKSEEYQCWQLHEFNKLRLEQCIRLIKESL